MIDPILSLAMSMRANKGAYALLLGSGVSRSSGIPTGWEVIVDLTRKLAHLTNEVCDPEPEQWYRNKFQKEPSYSDLLNHLGNTASERGSLLRTYFEPNEDEREQGLKKPTVAHHAVASLVSKGYIKVIITTNFDRLMEQALSEAGVPYQAISTPDAVDGSLPLAHSPCTVLKVHGDYQDTRIKNTSEELSTYDDRIKSILDRILDEYGLLVCGWSGEWDLALKDAIQRCKTHRFTTFWSTLGEPKPTTTDLISLRRAKLIQGPDADQLFSDLNEKILALEEFDEPHVISVPLAVANLKRYLPDPRHRIRLHDLITNETKRVTSRLIPDNFPLSSMGGVSLEERVKKYQSTVETLQALVLYGAYWDRENLDLWGKVFERIGSFPMTGGVTLCINLQRYPGLFLYYTAGIAAIAGKNYKFLAALARNTKVRPEGKPESIPTALSNFSAADDGSLKSIPSLAQKKLPMSSWLFSQLREAFRELIASDDEYKHTFDRFEYLNGILYADIENSEYGPYGLFVFREGAFREGPPILTEIEKELNEFGENWPPLKAGLFQSLDRLKESKKRYDDHISKSLSRLRW